MVKECKTDSKVTLAAAVFSCLDVPLHYLLEHIYFKMDIIDVTVLKCA